VLTGATVLGRLAGGIAAGFQFHPIYAAVAAALGAGLAGYRGAPRSRPWLAAAVVLVGWALGDGIRIAGSPGTTLELAAWAVTGLAVGYALPAYAGAYVGRQVHKGTGYLSAGVVAIMLVSAFSALAGPVGALLSRLAT
jgi:hypothetical protein